MGFIFKILKGLLVLIFLLLIILVLGRNVIVRRGVPLVFKTMTGLVLEMEAVDIGLLSTRVDIQGLKIHNPEGYADPLMLDLPRFYVDYNLPAILGGTTHLYDVKFHLKEAMLVKQKDGTSNIDAFKKLAEQAKPAERTEPGKKDAPKEQRPIRLDVLELQIGQIIIKDYSKGAAPVVDTYRVNINQRFENVTDMNVFASRLLLQHMGKFMTNAVGTVGLDKVGGLLGDSVSNVGKLGLDAAKTGVDAGKGAVDGAVNVLKGTADGVQNILRLPFGGGSE